MKCHKVYAVNTMNAALNAALSNAEPQLDCMNWRRRTVKLVYTGVHQRYAMYKHV